MKIKRAVTIKEIAKARDKLLKSIEKEQKLFSEGKLTEKEQEELHNNPEEFIAGVYECIYEEIGDIFDFDGEEEYD
jgi:hypothetical protein